MAQIIFPEELRLDQNKFGNQFVALTIIVDNATGDTSAGSPTVIKNVENLPLPRANYKNIVQPYLNSSVNDTAATPAGTSTNRDAKHVIFLPVPLSITTSHGVVYTTMDFTTQATKLASSAAGWLGKQAKAVGGKLGAVSSMIDQLSGVAETTLKAQGFKNKLSLNPHKELLFDSPKLREFAFNWKLIARTEKESDAIRNIVTLLRYHMHPALAMDGYLYKYPSDFDIDFYTVQNGKPVINNYLTFFATSVITNLTVDYSGGGEYTSFKGTSAPVQVDLTINFQETVIITKNFLQAVNKAPGGGKDVFASEAGDDPALNNSPIDFLADLLN